MSKNDRDERYDYLEYIKDLNDDEKEWIKKFYQEYHHGQAGQGEDKVIKSEEAKKEANRNYNAYKNDMIFRAKKDGNLLEINENAREFMEDASDEWQWQDAYKHFGYEEALECITRQALRDLNNAKFTIEITLNRYYEKRDRLRRQLNREKRK